MKATAKLRYLRMAPRKVRMVSDLIRGKKVAEAKILLQFAVKHSALPVLKILNSAIASAKNNFQAEESNLYISHISVNEGPKLKRYRPRARGQAYPIQKKTSHITMVLDEIEEQKTKAKTKTKKALPKSSAGALKRDLSKTAKQSFRPEQEVQKRQEQRGVQRFFRRKAV